jgi:NADPH:quinone reductase-like Zn-dependent oxidoreductase
VLKPDLHDGSIGELVTVPVALGIAERPASLALRDAGALGLAGAAALASLAAAEVGGGELVLVSGATGGVGSLLVQLAAARGARVIATARPGADAEFVRALGAAATVDYTADLAASVRELAPDGVDVAVHLAGDPDALIALVRDGGRFASTLGYSQEQAGSSRVSVHAVMASPNTDTLTALAALVSAGSLEVHVQRSYELNAAAEALQGFGRGTRGKLVISIP